MGLRCVIVEDQTMFLQMLHSMIRGVPDLEVVATARDVAEGLAACEQHKPDLLLLDLSLPDGSGVEVAKRLALLSPASKIVILSGEASTFVCPAILNRQVHAVIDKTQVFDDLAAELKILLPKARGGSQSTKSCDVRANLTAREYEIFQMIGRGLMSKEIAEKLSVSPHTIQAHRKKIAHKLGTSGPELAQQALRHYHTTLGAA